jgi:heme-degrading monooxygenase HmoA
MYAVVRNYAGSAGLADALAENESEVRRIISEIDGFHAYYLLRTADGAASISVFRDQAGAEASNQRAAEWLRDNLPDLSIGAPQISAGEVAISF